MIPGDLTAQLAAVIDAATVAGELPAAAASLSAAGNWRPVPADTVPTGARSATVPGSYASSLPLALARQVGRSALELAELLAARLSEAPGIAEARSSGSGYLTVTVTDEVLAGLAARVVSAGPACAASDALRGTSWPAPAAAPDLASAASWQQAWRWLAQETTARLAAAAGGGKVNTAAKRLLVPDPAPRPSPASVAAAIAFAGLDRVRYALARTAPRGVQRLGGPVSVRDALDDPFTAVQFACADAAATLRRAADLGISREEWVGWTPGALACARERELLTAISWLPDRVAGAGRRGQPHELAMFLESLAAAWLSCREDCQALPFGGAGAARDAATASARLWLAGAAGTALAAGLGLLGVPPAGQAGVS